MLNFVIDISTNVSATSSLVYINPMENSILISIEWHQNPDIVPMLGTYTVLINSPIEVGYSFITMNTSIELIVHYNLEYNITVFTNSCAGSRNLVLVDFLFSIGKLLCFFYVPIMLNVTLIVIIMYYYNYCQVDAAIHIPTQM